MANISHALYGFKLNWKNVHCIQLKKRNAKELLYNPWHNVQENSSYIFFMNCNCLKWCFCSKLPAVLFLLSLCSPAIPWQHTQTHSPSDQHFLMLEAWQMYTEKGDFHCLVMTVHLGCYCSVPTQLLHPNIWKSISLPFTHYPHIKYTITPQF